jgi:hypothetical protein
MSKTPPSKFDEKGPPCIRCNASNSYVIESRCHNGAMFRRRKCKTCKSNYTTSEAVIGDKGIKNYAFGEDGSQDLTNDPSDGIINA